MPRSHALHSARPALFSCPGRHAWAPLLLLAALSSTAARAAETRFADQELQVSSLSPFASLGSAVAIAADTGLAMATAPGDRSVVRLAHDPVKRTWSVVGASQWSGSGEPAEIGLTSGGDHLLYSQFVSDVSSSLVQRSPADPGGPLLSGISGEIPILATSGDYLAVGQPSFAAGDGRVLIYRFSGGSWHFDTVFLGSTDAHLGASLAMDGPVLVAGAPTFGPNGAVFVYAQTDPWIELQRLDAPVVSGGNARFGHAVALAGDNLVVGTPLLRLSSGGSVLADVGGIYTYDVSFLAFELEALVRPVGAAAGDHFGYSVALWRLAGNGLALAAGAPAEDDELSDQGAAYLFLHEGGRWSEQARLANAAPDVGEQVGSSVAVGPMGVLAGAPEGEGLGVEQQGAVLAWNGVVPLFYDGFESADTSGWDTVVP